MPPFARGGVANITTIYYPLLLLSLFLAYNHHAIRAFAFVHHHNPRVEGIRGLYMTMMAASSPYDETALPAQTFKDQDDKDFVYMGLALKHAQHAARDREIPVGAVLVSCDGEVLATGRNHVEKGQDASMHAELECLRTASRLTSENGSWRMLDSTLYVTLEPCLMCLGAIQNFRVKRLVYGAKSPLLGAVESFIRVLDYKHPFHQLEVVGGVRAEESAQLMQRFFRNRRREEEEVKAARKAAADAMKSDEDD